MMIPVQLGQPRVGDGKSQRAESHDERQQPAVAWQREMERAQMEAWLRQRPLGRNTTGMPAQELQLAQPLIMRGGEVQQVQDAQEPANASASARRLSESPSLEQQDLEQAIAAQLSPSITGVAAVEWMSFADAGAQAMDPPLPRTAMAPGLALPMSQKLASVWTEVLPGFVAAPAGARGAPLAPARAGQPVQPEAAPTARTPSPEPVQQPPVRVQYHLTEAGLAVWLGVDRGVALDVQALVMQLRQALERQGLKLHSLTHNGRAVLRGEPGTTQPSPAGESFESLSSPSLGAAP